MSWPPSCDSDDLVSDALVSTAEPSFTGADHASLSAPRVAIQMS
jgi:hypothetical protein